MPTSTNLPDVTNPDVLAAQIALTSRFNLTASQALTLIQETPVTNIATLASEVNRQAEVCESVVYSLMRDSHLTPVQALGEIQNILSYEINNGTISNTPHSLILRQLSMNYKFIQYGFSAEVNKNIYEFGQQLIQEHIADQEAEDKEPESYIDYYAESIKRRQTQAIAELVARVGLTEGEAALIVANIPTEQYDHIEHHVTNENTGFSARFKRFVGKLMAQGYSFEESTDALRYVALDRSNGKQTKYDKMIEDNLAPNEISAIRTWTKWHFGLLSEKMCQELRKQNHLNTTHPSCYPNVYAIFQPPAPVSVNAAAPVMRSNTPPQINLNSNLVSVLPSLCALTLLCLFLCCVHRKIYGLFCETKPPEKNLTKAKKHIPRLAP